MPAKASVTVLYIMGLWRSGSTILDIILGSHEQVEGVGELRNLQVGWIEGATCACGETTDRCAFWSQVRATWFGLVGEDRAQNLGTLQDRFERSRAFPRLLAEGVISRSPAFREYCKLVETLYTAIGRVGGKPVVVDSTKYPGRAVALSRMPGIDLRIVHLVRDGRAVIWSWHRKPNVDVHGNELDVDPQDVARVTTRSWLRTNMLSGLARSIAGVPSVRVRYEDLIADPRKELGRIGALVDLDYSKVADTLLAGQPLAIGHPASGNRVRSSEAIQLRPDLEWHDRLSGEDRREFWRRAGWLAKRYGYAE